MKKELARSLGGHAKSTTVHTGEWEGLSNKFADTMSIVTLNENVNRHINIVTNIAAMDQLNTAIARIKKGKGGLRVMGTDAASHRSKLKEYYEYTDAEIDRMVKDGIKPDDYAKAVQMSSTKGNAFLEDGTTRPYVMNTKLGRYMLPFTTMFRMGGILSKEVWHQAKRKNMAPLASLLVTFGLSHYQDKLKDMAYRKPAKEGIDLLTGMIGESISLGMFNVAATLGYYTAKYGDSITGFPMIDAYFNTFRDVWRAATKNEDAGRNVYKAIARQVPLVKALDAQFEGPLYQDRRGRFGQRKSATAF